MGANDASSSWQLECRAVWQRGAEVLARSQWADCLVEVGASRVPLLAHRLLLAMASPVFAAELYGAPGEGTEGPGYIHVPDMEPNAFTVILKYIYTDTFNVTSCKLARAVHYGARKYKLPFLEAKCISYLSRNLAPENVCSSYEVALFAEETELKNQCIEMMQLQTLKVLEASSFVEAREATVATMFSLESLHIESELQLLAAAERCANAKIEAAADGFSDALYWLFEKDSNEPAQEVKPCLRSAVEHIRFLTLSPRQFARHPMPAALLTDSEVMAVAMNVMSECTPVPMPRGFSECRKARNQVADKSRLEAIIQIEVDDITNLTTFNSETFYVRNLPWRVTVTRNDDCLGVGAASNCESEGIEWSCQTEVELHLLSFKPGMSSFYWKFNRLYTKLHHHWEITNFITWNILNQPEHGYIQDNKIVIEAHIKVQLKK